MSTQRVSRRGFVIGATGLVGGTALAGCTDSSTSGASTTPTASTTSAPASSSTTSTRSTTTKPVATPTATSTTATPSAAPSAASVPPAAGTVTIARTLATGIDVPWGLARLPGGDVLVSARDSFQVSRLNVSTGTLTLAGTVPGVVSNVSQAGEAGLLGLAVASTFASNRLVYVYYSTANDNRVGVMTYDTSKPRGQQLSTPRVLVSGIPHGVHHNGGRLGFGPDGYLYATTGESGNSSLAQDKSSLGGKILRMTTSGQPAPGNPFGSLVYTYGHRNVQGIAWDSAGRLWASEFGDKKADELNLIQVGHNYGWPATQGKTTIAGYTSPVAQWGTDEDSPSGIAIAAGSVWMAALKGQRLWRIPLNGTALVAGPQSFLVGTYGRLRSVQTVGDNAILITTSNRDGRQSPRSGDDRILLALVT